MHCTGPRIKHTPPTPPHTTRGKTSKTHGVVPAPASNNNHHCILLHYVSYYVRIDIYIIHIIYKQIKQRCIKGAYTWWYFIYSNCIVLCFAVPLHFLPISLSPNVLGQQPYLENQTVKQLQFTRFASSELMRTQLL